MPILRALSQTLRGDGYCDQEVESWFDALMRKGVRTYEDLVMCDHLTELSRECQIPFEVLNSWRKIIIINFRPRTTTLFDEVNRIEHNKVSFSFGCEKFDEVHGGIESGVISQISGDEASGKTQLCHSLAARAVLKDYEVVYIDTEATFSGERVVNMIKSTDTGVSVKKVWDKIQVVKAFDVGTLFRVLQEQDHSKTSLLVIDSMLGVLVPHVVQLGMVGENQQYVTVIREFAKVLKTLVINYPNLAVVVTIGNLKWFTKYWENVASFKLHLTAEPLMIGKDVVRKMEVQRCFQGDSQNIFNFTIQNAGLRDAV